MTELFNFELAIFGIACLTAVVVTLMLIFAILIDESGEGNNEL